MVAVPTDTVYGLACDPWKDRSVRRLYVAKNRSAKPVPVLCAHIRAAESLVEMNEVALALAKAHWPGGLTIVAPIREGREMPSRLLDQGSGFLGVRVPDSKVCLDLASKVGGAITGTSANVSGSASSRTAAEVARALEGRVQLVIDGGELKGKESTVVRVSSESVEVLREGAVRIQEGELRA